MKPKAILFDLDGTLLDRDAAFREFAQEQYRRFSSTLARIPRETYLQRAIDLDEHGYAGRTKLYRALASEFGLPGTLAERLTSHFGETYHCFCQCFPDVPSALVSLHEYGITMGIVTNGTVRMQEAKIRQLGLHELVDEVLISEREGVQKPDRRIFERALKRLSATSSEAWFVGDHPEVDISGAYEAGLTAFWRFTPYWPRPRVPFREIRDLGDLVHMVG